MTASAPTDTSTGSGVASPGRLIGVDAARGLAVLGMCLVHVNPTDGPTWLVTLAQGRSSALFAVLAGVSLALLSGGSQPPADLTATRWRIAVRALILLLLGLALTLLGTSVMVILCYYAVYFLLCLPLLRLGTVPLAWLSVITAVAGPVVSFLIRSQMEINEFGGAPTFDTVTDLRGTLTLVFLTGAYPVVTWIPFVLAGLALGRAGVATIRPARIIAAGAAAAVIGFGGSWFAQSVLGGRDRLLEMLRPMLADSGISADSILDTPSMGTTSTTSWWNLTLANPHSGTPFEIVGSIGIALVVIGGLTVICQRRSARRVLRPLIATGAMALTAYCLQIVLLAVFPPVRAEGERIVTFGAVSGWFYYAALVIVISGFATAWMAYFRRGPLESLLHRATALVGTRPGASTRGAEQR
ncbi:Heparan-alpha-glucosaminide N-acetyltransferase catalytic domain-containing protein OS=Tsukamurella paurometabola (strain ATCC 8368 / DSM / CCUG 35730 /CIP 100753 / JCM 10117 / KCTC 9821 / NBRC 16120 / NCIMB 702349/ NCTC 13040) OX=521096 GN=Tpau_0644 PE=4 SV=1 [Tsukamurella paurometabola]|uniref:Heparan-alpha-glucosaminide N-acetyltransferase catalytic domain-containing protein n=1 Tax=Tsukamurella paurometabola (strain ATCC 8368 / DSM 20162 / CCUG 35730 / CIP 100753 / JCM 10117 / KCTC 9821 / NBRC 16120 / NCIMB 702349 / NCTC 13040) TaxID=521096 RepID=D5USZ4_TSUPD|nr:DUF418 domain-containing protein [Tsukamurella paurometabola]ADG77281.1 conserved hypothetical protein [Tsukamurella paurometabola DSM 20162]SUP43374.1 Predicted membrane protein [Tsukamurella paurometabola]